MSKTAYFISDQHFGDRGDNGGRKERFISFLHFISGKADALFILGDFFDFYFEYKTQIPKNHYEIFCELREITKKGIPVHYFVGNHDFWVGSFLENLGMQIHRGPLATVVQGKQVFLAHGDGLVAWNPLKLILRNRICIFLFYLIHPDFAYHIADFISRLSRKKTKRVNGGSRRLYQYARRKFNEGFDGVIFGHIHSPKHIKRDNKDFMILGDWITHFSYGKMENGKLSLHFWKGRSYKDEG
jgi:UDP-2,3-diacylglucosamine hydrolase